MCKFIIIFTQLIINGYLWVAPMFSLIKQLCHGNTLGYIFSNIHNYFSALLEVEFFNLLIQNV